MGTKLVQAVKFLLFLVLIPLIVGMTVAFVRQVAGLTEGQYLYFVWGMASYLILHFFVYEPEPVYRYGKSLVADVFRFLDPLVEVAPLVLPIYSIVFLILFYFTSFFFKEIDLSHYYLFLISFTFAMHMIFTARDLRAQDQMAFKPNYFFSIALVYVINVVIIALMLNLIFPTFSFVEFFKKTSQISSSMYGTTFKQLFVP
ncbi:MAG: hypothetical protein P9M12_04445 [Candidatus Aceula lacicola]|nr:hypothetical protein [Candidatus Aceula lacicola]